MDSSLWFRNSHHAIMLLQTALLRRINARLSKEYGQALGALASSYMFAAHMGLDIHAGGNVEIELHAPAENRPPGIAEGDLASSVAPLGKRKQALCPRAVAATRIAPATLEAFEQR